LANHEAGFRPFPDWLERHRPDPHRSWHARLAATGNGGLDLADARQAAGIIVSLVNPARIKADGGSERARHKTDRWDAALIARFCRAQVPPPWAPPAAHVRELRELVRRCEARKAARVPELNRPKSGFASPAVAGSIAAHLDRLERQIEAVFTEVRRVIAADPTLSRHVALVRRIPGFGEVSAASLLAEIPTIAGFTPKALAAFAGLSPREPSAGRSIRRPGRLGRLGRERPRRTLFMGALRAKRSNHALADFVRRMAIAGKPPKVMLVAVARKLLVQAHAVIRAPTPFGPPSAPPQHS
jgi:transposase